MNPDVPQMSFCCETNRGVTKCWLFSQANLTPSELPNGNEQGRTGLSNVAGCRRKSPPTWLVSVCYSAWHFSTDNVFLSKISLDWPLTLKTQPSTSKLSDNLEETEGELLLDYQPVSHVVEIH